MSIPGPAERKLRNRLYFKIFGVWPRSVVDERLFSLIEIEMRADAKAKAKAWAMYDNPPEER